MSLDIRKTTSGIKRDLNNILNSEDSDPNKDSFSSEFHICKPNILYTKIKLNNNSNNNNSNRPYLTELFLSDSDKSDATQDDHPQSLIEEEILPFVDTVQIDNNRNIILSSSRFNLRQPTKSEEDLFCNDNRNNKYRDVKFKRRRHLEVELNDETFLKRCRLNRQMKNKYSKFINTLMYSSKADIINMKTKLLADVNSFKLYDYEKEYLFN